jgi:hypothetical protein
MGKQLLRLEQLYIYQKYEIPQTVSSEEYQTYLETNLKHAHCIQLLQECLDKLRDLALNFDTDIAASQKDVSPVSELLTNRFSSLELQEIPEENPFADSSN